MTSSENCRRPSPKVFVGICTGPAKEYAIHHMVAALRNLDYPNMELHWAVTSFRNTLSDRFRDQLTSLMKTVKWPCPWHIHVTYVDLKKPILYARRSTDKKTFYAFDMVIKNLRKLRGLFLDGDCDYFLEVGGDNPPRRNTIQRLLRLQADVAFGLCYQRPDRDEVALSDVPFPLVWLYAWRMSDLPDDLEPELVEQFKTAFINTPFLLPVYALKGWRRRKIINHIASGTGMVLIKRKVLERIGWTLPASRYFSEDMHFCHQANMHGFTTKIDMKFHVPHFHEDGHVY